MWELGRQDGALAVGTKLAKENPASAAAQPEVSVRYRKLGDVLVEAGDLAGARGRYEEALAVDTKLAKENPASAAAQRDLSVSYNKLGDVSDLPRALAAARRRPEEVLSVPIKLDMVVTHSVDAPPRVPSLLHQLNSTSCANCGLSE